jgi:GTP-binding protein
MSSRSAPLRHHARRLAGRATRAPEELSIDVPEEFLGTVIEKLGPRRGEMLEMKNPGQGLVRLLYRIPARGLFGYRSEFLTDTRGTGIMHHRFLDYGPWAGPLAGRTRGSLVSMEHGTIVAFAGEPAGAVHTVRPTGRRGVRGMAVGESARPGDMDEPDEGKEAHQHASKSSDENIQLSRRGVDSEAALEYIEDDELIEVTPQAIRLRKRYLSTSDRKRQSRPSSNARRGDVSKETRYPSRPLLHSSIPKGEPSNVGHVRVVASVAPSGRQEGR